MATIPVLNKMRNTLAGKLASTLMEILVSEIVRDHLQSSDLI